MNTCLESKPLTALLISRGSRVREVLVGQHVENTSGRGREFEVEFIEAGGVNRLTQITIGYEVEVVPRRFVGVGIDAGICLESNTRTRHLFD